jgi:hypothetical protein
MQLAGGFARDLQADHAGAAENEERARRATRQRFPLRPSPVPSAR